MDKNQLIKEVKRLVGEAEVGKALEQLLNFFEGNAKYKNFNAYALQIKAFLQKTSKEEELAIISNDQAKANYNKINYQILELIDRLEKDDLSWRPQTTSSPKMITVSISGVILLLIGAFFLFKWLQTEAPEPVKQICPQFKPEARFNILVFPYLTYDDNKLKPHQAIFDRLNDLAKTYKINLGIDYFKAEESADDFPRSDEQFSDRAKSCRANLAIWGRSEELSNQTILRTQYKFLDTEGSFYFNKIEIKEDTEIDTVPSISSIATNGTVTENIEQIILLLFGVIAHENGNTDAAIAVLESVEVQDSASSLLKGMTLADSYLRKNEPDKAAKVYDKVLEVHPNYWFALNNRGMIAYMDGDYEQSINDLTETIERRPNDTTALAVRGAAYIKTEQLAKAKKDLDKAKELDPNDRSIDAKLEDWNRKETELKRRKVEQEQQIERSPDNVQALTGSAQTNFKLGDYSRSIQLSERAITTNPQNLEAYATKIRSLIELGEREKAKATMETAVKNGIDREKLLDKVPELNRIINPIMLRRN